ncbi:hypothetical protein GCM10028811_09000 [Uliginosibacterium sediminicola]
MIGVVAAREAFDNVATLPQGTRQPFSNIIVIFYKQDTHAGKP